jgi:nucleoside-diphosphate-sugar epimerase
MMTIAIAGASGFIGSKLIDSLPDEMKVRALSRSKRDCDGSVEWVEVDLFSFQSSSRALKNVDVAVYLVHSMVPATKLFQGNFQDTDLIIADNFARACKVNNVKQIIYLGGLVPDGEISEHLKSRKEVEGVLKATGIPVTVLRAGMVVGDGGSSYEILKNLVLNLPIMILPKWTKSQTQTIYIDDLVRVIRKSIGNNNFYNKTINVVNGEKITYEQLISQTAIHFDKQEKLLPVPINYLTLSKYWVKIFGETNFELVSPLIDSLQCDLPAPKVVSEIKDLIHYPRYQNMLKNISKEKTKKNISRRKVFKNNTVRSVQRLGQISLDENKVGEEYFKWLPKHMRGLLRAEKNGDQITFSLLGANLVLLVLKRIHKTDDLDRMKFHIVGGLLTKTTDTGWLEFRSVSDGKYLLSSINEFVPSLPWFVYKYTQAPVHEYVMNEFAKYLKTLK